MINCERYPVFLLVMLVLFLSCGSDNREDYFDTSGVDYSRSTMKLLATEFIGNEYMKYYEIKTSINIPIDESLTPRDTILVRKYLDSVISTLNIQERATVHCSVFNETNYTNLVFHRKKNFLSPEFSPYVMEYGFTYHPKIESARGTINQRPAIPE